MGYRTPDAIARPVYRCSRGLAAGTATANATTIYEVVPVHGSARIRITAKATNAGTLDCFGVGPDFDVALAQAGTTAYSSLVGTIYATGNMSQLTLAANTEISGTLDLYGWGYVILKFTGTATGAITYIDVAQI